MGTCVTDYRVGEQTRVKYKGDRPKMFSPRLKEMFYHAINCIFPTRVCFIEVKTSFSQKSNVADISRYILKRYRK